jgi:pyrroline-5-carboxylate reductase
MTPTDIAFVGGGNMARALIAGLVRQGQPPGRIAIGEPSEPVRFGLARDFGVRVMADNAAAVRGARAVVLAVKPQDLAPVSEAIGPALRASGAVAISIAAGVPVGRLRGWLGESVPVVRAMPNRPALVGAGVTGLYAPPGVAPAQRQLAEATMSAAGSVVWIDDEALMDVVTAVSGSGPAYFFLLAEALAEAGEAAGLPAQTARRLAVATLAGAGRMIDDADADLATFRAQVTSRGGTTEAALRALEHDGFRAAIGHAVQAAVRRGHELASAAASAGDARPRPPPGDVRRP